MFGMLILSSLLYLGAYESFAVPVYDAKDDVLPSIITSQPNYRLPGDVIPIEYKIDLDLNDFLSKINNGISSFKGKVNIKAKTIANVKCIRLHAKKLTITSLSVLKDNNDEFKEMTENKPLEYLDLILKTEIQTNAQIEIKIEYEGQLGNTMHGFYLSSYVENNKMEYLATTQFQPTHARLAFPCFDEPQYKAVFHVQITRPADYTSISNMEQCNSAANIDIYHPTKKMSTYLLAFIVSKFKANDAPDKRYKVWARPSAAPQTKYAVENGLKMVDALNNFTGIDYFTVMPKLDMAALPDFSAGAMENWGLLTYRETALLVDAHESTNRDKQRVASVIAHELAHQWFGNYVTLKWWDNTWLNEGFARYFEYHTTGMVMDEWQMSDQFLVEQQQAVFSVDALNNTTPLNNIVNTPTEIQSHFGSISYNKGASVIRMMEHFLGHKTYKKALGQYLLKNKFANAEPHNLWEAIEVQAREDMINLDSSIDHIMTTWIQQPGYPVVHVNVKAVGMLSFSQGRFFLTKNDMNLNNKWYVPISFTTSQEQIYNDTKPKFWLLPNEPEKNISVENLDWIIVNLQGSGYYRVNYDQTLWGKITSALKSEKIGKNIHYLNKAQLVDDVMNLARAGHVNYSVAFKLISYLSNENSYFPWYSAFKAFTFLLQRYKDTDATGKNLRAFIFSLMGKLLIGMDLTNQDDDDQIETFNRVQALEWSCNLGHEECVNNATGLFKKFMISSDKETLIPKNLKSVVYCSALRAGGIDEFVFLWTRFTRSNVAAEKVRILNVLGCTNNDILLMKALNYSISDDIRQQDASYVFTSVYTGNSKGVDIAFDFLQENYIEIAKKYGGMNALGDTMIGLAARLNTKEQVKKFDQFLIDKASYLKDVKVILDAAIEKSKESIAWAEKYADLISGVIEDVSDDNGAASFSCSVTVFISVGLLTVYLTEFWLKV